MKEVVGYLIDRTTGLGIAGKTVTYKRLDGTTPVVGVTGSTGTAGTYWQSLGSPTDADGKFIGRFELSPGPINIEVDVAAAPAEKKARKHDEKAQMGIQWSGDISRGFRGIKNGVIDGFLNELAVSIPAGHTIRVATGGAIIDGGVFTIENGNLDIPGSANPAGPANPRVDLITLRQYKESAAGQDSGRQAVVVTEGTVSGTAPATPTGADFVDLPIATVSTALGAGTKTAADVRSFTAMTQPPFINYATNGAPPALTNSHQTYITPTVTGLNPLKTYDGEVKVEMPIRFTMTDGGAETVYVNFNHANVLDNPADILAFTGQVDREGDAGTVGHTHVANVVQSWPVIGVTGVSSLAIPIRLRRGNLVATGSVQPLLGNRGWLVLKER